MYNKKAIKYYEKGRALHQQGKLRESERAYKKAIRINANFFEAYNNLGNVLIDMGRPVEASSMYRKAIDILPDHPMLLNNFGNSLQLQGNNEEAIKWFGRSVANDPNYADTYSNLGNALSALGRLEEAVSSYGHAIEIAPDSASAYTNLGSALRKLGDLHGAVASHDKAILLNPKLAKAYSNRGNAQKDLGKLEDAIVSYRNAVELDPNNLYIIGQLYYLWQSICNWDDSVKLSLRIDNLIDASGDANIMAPFFSVSRTDDLEKNYIVAKSYSNMISEKVRSTKNLLSFEPKIARNKSIRIGYLSGDIHNHATAHLMLGVFREHNRNDFDIYVYSYGKNDNSYYRKEIIGCSDKFIDISLFSYAGAASQIYNDKIDILVDLKGHTQGSRLEICALQPAPVQVTYLGFPGTSGADFFDYVLTDSIVTPIEHSSYYSEKFVFLPHTYQSTDNEQEISCKELLKEDFGLPDDGFIFSSFCQSYKIDPVFYDVWMRLLQNVRGSVLWLFSNNNLAIRNLKSEAEKRGIDPDRIVFADEMQKDEHLRRIQLVNLMLDTRIYNGHTTTSDALWAGVPVVVMEGNHFASRVSSSLLHALDLPEMVTTSIDEYEALALDLALCPERLQSVVDKIHNNKYKSPLFDTKRFTSNLEEGYRLIIDKKKNEGKVDHIFVEDV